MTNNLKPILYYTLVGRGYRTGYAVFGVTSETGRRRLNGRLFLEHGGIEPTHTTKLDIFGRFDTEQAARDKITAIIAVREKYKPLIDAAAKQERDIRSQETREIQEVLGISSDRVF
jgi:hypothetical protein